MRLTDLRRGIVELGKESWILFTALSLTNASNYIFHVVISRMLGPADYGALSAILAFLIVISVPLAALQTTIAREVAADEDAERKRQAWTKPLTTVVPVALWLSLVLALASPLLTMFLRLDSPVPALLLACYPLPALLSAVLRGGLQGNMRFRGLALVSAAPVGIRLLVGVGLVAAGAGISGALAATIVAEFLGLGICWLMLRPRAAWRRDKTLLRPLLKQFLPTAAGLSAMWLLIELDLMLARRFLTESAAGEYAAAGMLARAVLFVPGAISMIALPHFARTRSRGTDAYRWLVSSCATVTAIGAVVAGALFVGGETAMRITFGESFTEGSGVLPLLSLAMVALGIINLLVYFHIAAGSWAHQILWPLSLIEGITIAFFHGSPEAVATTVLVVTTLVAVMGLVSARHLSRSRPAAERLPRELWVHGTGSSDDAELELSVILPSYNGGPPMVGTVMAVVDVLRDCGKAFEVIVVSDGSTDSSLRDLAASSAPVSILHYKKRQGKGVALRVGMSRAHGRHIAFLDSDGDLDPTDLSNFVALMDLYDPHVVLGSKRHPLSTIAYPWSRRVMSFVYHCLVRIFFGLNVRDTQTGIKLIRRDVLDDVLPRMLEKRFAFDLELLVVARSLGYRRFFEAPVSLSYQFSSTVSPPAVAQILTDTAAIFYRRYLLRYYDEDQGSQMSEYAKASREFPLFAAVEAASVEQGIRD